MQFRIPLAGGFQFFLGTPLSVGVSLGFSSRAKIVNICLPHPQCTIAVPLELLPPFLGPFKNIPVQLSPTFLFEFLGILCISDLADLLCLNSVVWGRGLVWKLPELAACVLNGLRQGSPGCPRPRWPLSLWGRTPRRNLSQLFVPEGTDLLSLRFVSHLQIRILWLIKFLLSCLLIKFWLCLTRACKGAWAPLSWFHLLYPFSPPTVFLCPKTHRSSMVYR